MENEKKGNNEKKEKKSGLEKIWRVFLVLLIIAIFAGYLFVQIQMQHPEIFNK